MSNILIARLAAVFGPADHTENPQAFIGELERLTKPYSKAVLNAASDDIIRDYRPTSRKPWPAPAEIVKACQEAAADDKPTADDTRRRWQQPLVDDSKAADEFMTTSPSTLVHMALRDGWGRTLRDNARGVIRAFREKHQRRPTPTEMLNFRMSRSEVDWARRYGQGFLATEQDRIWSARQQAGQPGPRTTIRHFTDTDAADPITGEVA